MEMVRGLVESWLRRLRVDQLSRTRQVALVALCALLILTICSTVLAIGVIQAIPDSPARTSTAHITTPTSTSTSTSTTAPRPTATRTPRPIVYTKTVPKIPPPPPVPTPPLATPTTTYCTPTPVPPTATPVPPTATGTLAPTPTPTGTGGQATATATTGTSGCQPCPYYAGNNPSQATIQSALVSAADAYGLPRVMLYAVAWQESRWHEDVSSCDGGIGLMQLQYYTWPWVNTLAYAGCGLSTTNYDPYNVQGNADLGAKYLRYISCYYSYYGDSGGTLTAPAPYTVDSYYLLAGLPYPDTTRTDGKPSLCLTVFTDPNHPEYPAMYPGTPPNDAYRWSCPYSATINDTTLLDITLSAYNEGMGYTSKYGIQNGWYVVGVEGFMPQFASGALPIPS